MTKIIDNPEINDNRNYNYEEFPATEREEYPIIVNMVKKNAKVIDLACGNGTLLEKLKKEKNTIGCGIEISKSAIAICKKKGLNVTEGRIDQYLPFEDNTFDYAICNVTIQMVMYPEILLREMKRIARYQIVSFPNFAYYPNRIELLRHGRMPKTMLFGYQWYSTGHIHQVSIKDFIDLVKEIGQIRIVKNYHVSMNFFRKQFPNLFQITPIFLLEKIND